MTPTPRRLLEVAVACAREAGLIALDQQTHLKVVVNKGEKDIVTEVDLACDKLIRTRILQAFPDHNLITEESENQIGTSAYTWHVDPIDGTINYSRGMPLFGISVGVALHGQMLAGAAFLPATHEMFTAIAGEGAFLNEHPIRVSPQTRIESAILSHGDFNVGSNAAERHAFNERNFRIRLGATEAVQRVKCLGSAVVEGCYIASGRMEGYGMVTLNSWDVAVTSLLVREAGGEVTTLDGSPFTLESRSALFSNGKLHAILLALMHTESH